VTDFASLDWLWDRIRPSLLYHGLKGVPLVVATQLWEGSLGMTVYCQVEEGWIGEVHGVLVFGYD
jgi:hypothetical protein